MINTRAEARAWIDRWARWHETRELFVDLLVDGDPDRLPSDAIPPAKFERCWRIACGRVGLSEAIADEMRDTARRHEQMRRVIRLACVSGRLRRRMRAIVRAEPAFDALFARWREICPTAG